MSQAGRESTSVPGRDVWPLVGRDEELELLRRAVGPSGTGVVLAGPAGVGKTRLARECLESVRGDGIATEWVTATQAAASIPLGAFAHLIPQSALRLGADRLLQFRAAAGGLLERSDGRHLVIGVDDAHVLDPASAALVLHLASVAGVSVVATVRAGEPCPEPIVALWKDDWVTRFDVQALGRVEVSQLLESVVGGPLDAASSRRLFEISQGNALFLHELVTGALASGALAQDGGIWRWSGDVKSERLRETVARTLRGLTPEQHRCVRLLAVGEPLGLDLVEAVGTAEALAEVEQRGLVDVNGEAVRFSHPLYGEVLRQQMPATIRRTCSRELAEALIGLGPKERDLLRLATWQLDGGGPLDAEMLARGAREANARFDFELAIRLATASRESGAGLAAALPLAEALASLSRPDESEAVLVAHESEAPASEFAEGYARLRVSLLHGSGRTGEAEDFILRADSWRDDAPWKRTLALLRQRVLLDAGRFDEAREDGLRLIRDPTLDPTSRIWVAAAVGPSLGSEGRAQDALALAEEIRLLASEAADEYGVLTAMGTRFVVHFWDGDWLSIEPELLSYRDKAAEQGNVAFLPVVAYLLAQIRITCGDLEAAVRLLHECSTSPDPLGYMPAYLSDLAYAHAETGDLDGAVAHLAATDAVLAQGPGDIWWQRSFLVRAQMWTAAMRGDLQGAWNLAKRFAGGGTIPLLESVMLHHEALRLGVSPESVAQELDSLAARADSRLMSAFVDHARALAAKDAAALDAVAALFESFGANLLAAEAAAEASAFHQKEGKDAAARRSSAVSTRLAATCPSARTPALVREVGHVFLTPRERQVAALVARGMSNSEIAQQLMLSIRTVESHVYRGFLKLGVSSRDELSTVLLGP